MRLPILLLVILGLLGCERIKTPCECLLEACTDSCEGIGMTPEPDCFNKCSEAYDKCTSQD